MHPAKCSQSKTPDPLEEQAFINVEPDPWDRRKDIVSITGEGERALAVLVPMARTPSEYLHVRGPRRRDRQESLDRYSWAEGED